MTDTNQPQWSDWHTVDLGYVDTPQAIVCRLCHTPKPATALHFRKKGTRKIGFSTTCMVCEDSRAYHHTLNARMAAVNALTHYKGAPITPAEREAMLTALPGAIARERKAKLSKCQHAKMDARFKTEWTTVRKLIVARRAQLTTRIAIHRSHVRHLGTRTGISILIDSYPEAKNYVTHLLGLYSTIIARLRNLQAWHATIAGHMPPGRWLDAATPPYELSPLEFATAGERDTLAALDPDKLECAAWREQVSDTERKNARLLYELYPLMSPSKTPLKQTSPAWLRKFNGA